MLVEQVGLVQADAPLEVGDALGGGTGIVAVGHGVSVRADKDDDGVVRRVRTTWIPRAEVRRVERRGGGDFGGGGGGGRRERGDRGDRY